MPRNSNDTSTKRQRIAEMAKQNPQMAFTSLNHLLDLDLLREAFYRTPKKKAPGIDGQTWADYEANLEDNLQSLLDRAKSGTYRAPPVRRVHIPKGSGSETRPRPTCGRCPNPNAGGQSASASGGHVVGTAVRTSFP